MRRVLFGIVWFFIFAIGGLAVGGGIAGGVAGANDAADSKDPPTTFSEGYRRGSIAGHSAGQEFGRKYGRLIVLGSLLFAVGGSVFGILPGTKRRIVESTRDT
jgi:hypothetical protein